jgi:hypothetical protein
MEDVFRNIRRRHVRSKITIPISNLSFLAGALDSDLSIELMEKETSVRTKQIGGQWVPVANFKREIAYGTAAGIGTYDPTNIVIGTCAGTTIVIEPKFGVGPNVEIGTTVDELTSPLSAPIIRPSGREWASA